MPSGSPDMTGGPFRFCGEGAVPRWGDQVGKPQMLFNSQEFLLVFLPGVLAGTWLVSRFGRRAVLGWLLACSLGFYGWWDYRYVPLLLASIAVNYVAGRRIMATRSMALTAAAVVANIFLLGYFKYYDFSLAIVSGARFSVESIAIPLGISFFTFHQIAYLVDCRRGEARPHDWLDYGVFVSVFPQLIAGPILSQKHMFPQLTDDRLRPEGGLVAVGATVFTIGLFKKAVIADGVADWANTVFDAAASGKLIMFPEAWAGALSYTFQIYFDFSGYSDMAIGLGLMLGLRLPENFSSPYRATSIIEFWRRWHMTLSWFLREYLYFPLGGGRCGFLRRYGNLFIVMVLGGLWHGAGWTFVAWGGLHGLYLVVAHGLRAALPLAVRRSAWVKAAGWASTFLAVVAAWVFFRASGFQAAWSILSGMAGLEGRMVLPPNYLAALPAWVGRWVMPFDGSMHFGGVHQLAVLATLTLWVLVLPNTRSLVRSFSGLDIGTPERTLPDERRSSWWAFVGGAVCTAIVVSYVLYQEQTEFLYFQF